MAKKTSATVQSQLDFQTLRDRCLEGASQGRNDFELCIVPLAQKWADLPTGFRDAVLKWKRSVNPDEEEWPKNWASFRHSYFLLPYYVLPVTGSKLRSGLLNCLSDYYASSSLQIASHTGSERLGIVLRTWSIMGENGTDPEAMLPGEKAYVQFEEFAGLILQRHCPEFRAKNKVLIWRTGFVSYLWHPDRRPKLKHGFATVRNLWLEALKAIDQMIQPPESKRRSVGKPHKEFSVDENGLLRAWEQRDKEKYPTQKDFAESIDKPFPKVRQIIRTLQRRRQRGKHSD